MLITFSGLDGSGKTTLIEELRNHLTALGRESVVLTMYDDLSIYALLRRARDRMLRRKNTENVVAEPSSQVLGEPPFWSGRDRDPKIGVSDKKNIGAKILYSVFRSPTARRCFLFADALSILIHRMYHEVIRRRIFITDRYLYDTLADVADLKKKRWLFINVFLAMSPRPDISVFVDVPPEEAYRRKHEYPIEYMQWRRDIYQAIFARVPGAVIIPNADGSPAAENVASFIMPRIK